MCSCVDIEIGSYNNQVEVFDLPEHMKAYSSKYSNAKSICIDKCLQEEIINLWLLGITTTGCCCGHNKLSGYIGVIESDIIYMKQMGYKVLKNELRPNDQDSFIPNTN